MGSRLRQLASVPSGVAAASNQIPRLIREVETSNLLAGKLLANQVKALGAGRELRDVEFRVFSQWGDVGIIQYLIHNVPIPNDTFVEFGVEDYREANTRFLLLNDNWRGLIMKPLKGVVWVGVHKLGGTPTIWASSVVSGQAFVRNNDPQNPMGLLPTKRTPMLRLEVAP